MLIKSVDAICRLRADQARVIHPPTCPQSFPYAVNSARKKKWFIPADLAKAADLLRQLCAKRLTHRIDSLAVRSARRKAATPRQTAPKGGLYRHDFLW
jgi:hypothetical protein